MSVTVAHRPHVHLPLKWIAVFAAAVLAAAAIIVLVDQSGETQRQSVSAGFSAGAGATANEVVAGPQAKVHPLARPGVSAEETGVAQDDTPTVGRPGLGPDAKPRVMLLAPNGTKKAGFAAGSSAGAAL